MFTTCDEPRVIIIRKEITIYIPITNVQVIKINVLDFKRKLPNNWVHWPVIGTKFSV